MKDGGESTTATAAAASSVRKRIAEEVHKPARKNFVRRRVEILGLNDLIECDLVEMIPHAKANKNYKYLLTAINAFSKYAWAVPLKSKSGGEVAKALDNIFREIAPPKNAHTDRGKEFYNAECKKVFDKYSINHYSTYSEIKAPLIERFNRTLKTRMYREFSARGTYRYLEFLPEILDDYNRRTVHRTTGYAPVDVNSGNEREVLHRIYRATRRKVNPRRDKPKFRVNDFVRVSRLKRIFTKGYEPSWSHEIYSVAEVKNTLPVTYSLKDWKGEVLKGVFYEKEITLLLLIALISPNVAVVD